LNFQNQVLSVTMVSQNFAALEKLQQQLQQLNVKVTQAQAASDEGKVKAILELSL
jgi:general secretion pathway protein L